MLYGLIGEHLSHSYSCEIHASIADYDYQLLELAPEEVGEFLKARRFEAVNVTIPYKEKVMPYLDFVSDEAKGIGAVNTVVNRGGRLCGYNTDLAGMTAMLKKYGIEIKNKKVLILGTGGTSKTAFAAAKQLCAREIIKVSRGENVGAVTYGEALEKHLDAEVIINTTPVGMFSREGGSPIDISAFKDLGGVADAIYNPLRTELVLSAKKRGIPACGGLYMLAAQAVYASALFLGKEADGALIDKAFYDVEKAKENIVLIGMPSSGKSTVGRAVAERLGRQLFDSDSEIVKETGMPISEYFEKYGENAFRRLERETVKRLSARSGCVIATGGGVAVDAENVSALRKNGKIFFLDRSLEKLTATADRPLSSSPEALKKRYGERYPIYSGVCDFKIDGNGSVEAVSSLIIDKYNERG